MSSTALTATAKDRIPALNGIRIFLGLTLALSAVYLSTF